MFTIYQVVAYHGISLRSVNPIQPAIHEPMQSAEALIGEFNVAYEATPTEVTKERSASLFFGMNISKVYFCRYAQISASFLQVVN
jgi:hypothetical protein